VRIITTRIELSSHMISIDYSAESESKIAFDV